MTKWQEKLLKYGKLAYETGQELKFSVIKRQGERRWRIYLTKIVDHGEEKYFEDD